MNGRELVKLMKKEGWMLARVTGSHHWMVKEGCRSISVPVHGKKDLPKGLLHAILREAGLEE